jgi:hypothetical protein
MGPASEAMPHGADRSNHYAADDGGREVANRANERMSECTNTRNLTISVLTWYLAPKQALGGQNQCDGQLCARRGIGR